MSWLQHLGGNTPQRDVGVATGAAAAVAACSGRRGRLPACTLRRVIRRKVSMTSTGSMVRLRSYPRRGDEGVGQRGHGESSMRVARRPRRSASMLASQCFRSRTGTLSRTWLFATLTFVVGAYSEQSKRTDLLMANASRFHTGRCTGDERIWR